MMAAALGHTEALGVLLTSPVAKVNMQVRFCSLNVMESTVYSISSSAKRFLYSLAGAS